LYDGYTNGASRITILQNAPKIVFQIIKKLIQDGEIDEEELKSSTPDQEKSFGIKKVFVNGKLILDGEALNYEAAKRSGKAMPV